ncbi:hypothetical protein [Sodalis sp. RH16]|uniref:hypothetical protein n=1 Tax=Sodalis sp. RH16 TaxID=3394331 RepID=UPI0039B54A34
MCFYKATSLKEAENILKTGKAKKVEFAFAMTSDEFFELTSNLTATGGKITKENGNFIFTLKNSLSCQHL